MVRMERVHILQKALNMQEQREIAMLDHQWRNRMRRARRLTSMIFDMNDEALNGNKVKFEDEKHDTLFMKKLVVRRLASSSDTDEKGDEDDPDVKKRIENLNEM